MSTPPTSDLVSKARDLYPALSAQAEANERAGRLTDETVDALRRGGFFGLLVPRCFGGSEAWPTEALEVVETLSYADGSTGWVLMASQVAMASAAAYLPADSASELFGECIPVIAGQGGPMGRAEAVEGGYRLSGQWRYGSGLLHADYLHTGAVVTERGEPRRVPGTDMPEVRIFVLPVGQADLRGNWDVIGLRATGSIDYAISDVFVPEAFTHAVTAKRPHHGGDLYRMAIPGMSAIGHSGFALGVGRRALDELAALATASPPRTGMVSQTGGTDAFQEQFAAQEAKYRAARAFAYEAQRGVEASLRRGEDPATREITLARLAMNSVTTMIAEVCGFAYKYGGGVSLRESALQRCLRDMHAATQHAWISPGVLRDCGRELLGFAPDKVWGPRTLIDPV